MDQDPDTSYSEDAASSTDNQDNICNVEEYNDVAAKQRASVLWLLSKAYMPKIPSELYDPCYIDHEGNERLKPQIVHALANAELYCLALANIYADPNYHNLNHHGILQVLMRKGIEIIEPSDTTLTETVMVQTAPIRMSAHMVVIEAIMALFVKEVLIPEKVMEVISRYANVNPESELPYDSEEAALLWVNKSCIKLKHRIEDQLVNFHSSEGPNSSPTRKFRPPMIALAQDLGDLSDGCCLSALLSLYCPKYFHWQDIRLNDPISLADSVHNLQLVQKFCHEHLPQDVFCLTLEDMVYLHPSILPNVLTLIADLMYIFEIRPPKHICRPGYEEENRISEDFAYLNVNGQSPVPNCKRQSTQRSASPIHDSHSEPFGSNDETGSMSPQTSNGTWQKLQKSSSRKMVVSEGNRIQDNKKPYESGCEIQTSHPNYPAEEDDELAGYFSPQHHSPSQSLLDQDDNRRTKQSHPTDDGSQQTHYRVFHATNPLRTDYSSVNDRTRKGGSKAHESREPETKSSIKKSPSSYEIHQLSPSKQNLGKQLQGYSRQRSQSELDIPQERKQISASNRISYSEVEETQVPNKMQHKGATEARKNRNSFHEMPRYNTLKENEKQGKFSLPRRNNSDFFLHERQDIETRANRLSGSQTWRKPKDLFARTEFLEEGDQESGIGGKNQDDQENIMSFANLSKHRNDSGSSINIVYTHQDRDQVTNTYKKATRPGYLHISPSQKSIPSNSPTSATKVNNWVTDNSRIQQEDIDGSIAAQMIDIRLQLEEKRKKIEQEKLRLEAMTKKQREKVGKAAFLQAVKNSNMYEPSGRVGGRNFSVDDLTEDLDSVRRKWLEKRCEQDTETNCDDKEHESPSEDFQNSIEQLNCNLSDLQSDISRLTQQQETIQNMLRGSGQTPHQSESYFLHDASTPQQQETSRWAEPMQHSNNMYQQQQPMPAQEVPHVGRGHWGQPVIPFSNLQPPHQQNTSNWQQSSPMYPGRPASVEPQMMSGQHMNMQHQMYESPQFPGGMPQRFSLHPQQQQPNFGMHMQPPNTYSNDQMQNFYPNQYPGQYTGIYQQPNYNVMQNTYSGGVQNPSTQSQYPNAGFHLHRSPSANYITNREYAGSPNQPGRHFNPSQTEPMQIPRSLSKADVSYAFQENSGSLADEFGRLPKGSTQHSPPNRPMLGKTFRVSKPKLTSPLSPSQNQTSPFAQDSEQTQETVPRSPQPPPSPPPPPAKSSSLTEKGFYISFDEADLPKKPKPKLKPKHLKARSQQKKMDRESENDSTRDTHFHLSGNTYRKSQMKENDTEFYEDRFGSAMDSVEEKENKETRNSQDSSRTSSISKSPGVGFVIGTETVQPDPDKELEMTRRKEMIMMMSLRRRAEQEAKRNQKQQEYIMKKEEERMKSEQMERKKEEEKLRRQLILEQYRQRKAAEEDDGPSGGRDDHRPVTKGTPVTRPKSRSTSVTRSKPKSSLMSSGRTHDLSSPSSLDSPVGKGSQYNLSSGYHDDVSSEHSYTPSPRRSQNYPHSSPISPSSYPSSPGPLLPGLLSSGNRSRGTPSDGLSDTSSTISSAWASEYTGPKLFVKPSTKSNRGIITNAINTVLAGAVNSDTKRKVLEEIDRSDGKHFLILFRDAGCQFRALYSYNPETEEVIKMYGIGPRVVSNKMMDRFYKYNSGGKSFTQIHTKHLTATIDAFTIQNSLWQSKKVVPLKRDYL